MKQKPSQPGLRDKQLLNFFSVAAVVSAGLFVLCFSLRTLPSLDLGYHLAYGEQLVQHGRLVDHNAFLYTLPSPALPPSQRPEPGPGCWYDSAGRYRFPNANWLSQGLMYLAWAAGGTVALSVLHVLLVSGAVGFGVAQMRRFHVPWVAVAVGMLLMTWSFHLRNPVRPELLGYLVLAGEAFLLGRAARDSTADRRLLRWEMTALVGLQLLFVNLHSYWPLGLALTGALLVEQLLRWGWVRWKRPDPDVELPAAWKRTAVTFAAQVAVSLANPWTWRIAILPIQTLGYMRKHHIGDPTSGHPWASINELVSLWSLPIFPRGLSDYVMILTGVLAGLGLISAVLRRRWTLGLWIGGMALVGMSAIRNAPAATLIVVPSAMGLLIPGIAQWKDRLGRTPSRLASLTTAGVVVAASVWGGTAVVTQRLYGRSLAPMRFGMGASRLHLPIGLAKWLDESLPDANVWCDMPTSSTIHFFTRPHRSVPVLTNTWAYPPAVLAENITLRRLNRQERESVSAAIDRVAKVFTQYCDQRNILAAVVNHQWSSTLFIALSNSPDWALVRIEGMNGLYLRRSPRTEALIETAEMTPETLDTEELIRLHQTLDPVPATALHAAGSALWRLQWYDAAETVLQQALKERDDIAYIWARLGTVYLMRARRAATTGQQRMDVQRARRCFLRARQLDADISEAREGLRLLPHSL